MGTPAQPLEPSQFRWLGGESEVEAGTQPKAAGEKMRLKVIP
jgi:hypothetical protein